MTKRIFRSFFGMAAIVLLACLALSMSVAYRSFETVESDQLSLQAELCAHGVEAGGEAWFDGLKTSGYRFTWIAADGAVLYDNQADASAMENHAQRDEVRQALETGEGASERYSATLMEKTVYRAVRLSDGSVLRAAVTQRSLLALALQMARPVLLVAIAAILLSWLWARRLSQRIVEPLNHLDLTQPLTNEAYEELAPLLTHIEHQHRQIDEQLDTLRRKQGEFSTVTSCMSEGLLLLGSSGDVLSVNPAAERLFETGPECVGKNLLTLNRSAALQELVASAQAGQRAEAVLKLHGGLWQVEASPIADQHSVATGVCLLAFDVTQKELAEQMRREFSANVSHELKTPLQTILGSSELLENQLVKPEDTPLFIHRIHAEASRLVTLIDDIIRLSQLDEGGSFPKEPVDLKALAQEAMDSLASEAEKRGVTLNVTGDSVRVEGVKRLLSEMVFNLCDNAVKYNLPGGTVTAEVRGGKGGPTLTVIDTGIGIPREQQARVFERFYRVDKSHSRATGGTGLGLSIVKHAAQYHGATVSLESELGKGTRIQVRFPAA
ncbi:MAG: ATP-binding protein [Eubacteriales bacterium]|nr:ATP-binding protein [Eubacteriales bacterium]